MINLSHSRRVERYSFPRTLGTGSRIPITNCCCSGLLRLQAWTAFSETPAIHPACRESNSQRIRSTKLLANMGRNFADRVSGPSFPCHYVQIGGVAPLRPLFPPDFRVWHFSDLARCPS